MRFTALFTSFLFALPSVLGAAAAPSTDTTWTAPNGLVAHTSGASSLAVREATVELQTRQIAEAAIAIATIISSILTQIQNDNLGRGEFTKMTVMEGRNKFPHLNWVICHTAHRHFFDGQQGQQWGHYHREYDIRIGGTIGYEIYWFESGRFERHGDGGWLNWAYIGDVIRTENNGATVIFG